MSQIDRNHGMLDAQFHAISHYDSPADVVRDRTLSSSEKRVILSSWASDMYAVESSPGLREIPGIAHRIALRDIMAALRELDDEDEPMPSPDADYPRPLVRRTGSKPERPTAITSPFHFRSRWTREANVQRYRKLLMTQLTDDERQFIARRLDEELRALEEDFEASVGHRRDLSMQPA